MTSLSDLESGVQCLRMRLAPKCDPQHIPVSCYTDGSILMSCQKTQQQKNIGSHFPTNLTTILKFRFPYSAIAHERLMLRVRLSFVVLSVRSDFLSLASFVFSFAFFAVRGIPWQNALCPGTHNTGVRP